MFNTKQLYRLLLASLVTLVLCCGCSKGDSDSNSSDGSGGVEFDTCKVYFDSNGGTSVETQEVDYNTPATEPTPPTKEEEIFEGWCSDKTLTQRWSFETNVTEDMILYAEWSLYSTDNLDEEEEAEESEEESEKEEDEAEDDEAIYYTITFNSNGGTSVEPQKLSANSIATEPQDPTKEGATFEGWYSDEELTQMWSFTQEVSSDVTLYAKWQDLVSVVGISSAAELKAFRDSVNSGYGDIDVVLTGNIDLSGEAWSPIGSGESCPYRGSFDGGKYAISNLQISTSESYQALFGYVSNGEIIDLKLSNPQISGGSYVGALCGVLGDGAYVSGCEVEGGSISGESYVGGVVGAVTTPSSVQGSYNTASVSGQQFIGGVAGATFTSSITACYNTGAVSGSSCVGGVVGASSSSSLTVACYSVGKVSGSSYTNGVVGYLYGSTISQCYFVDAEGIASNQDGAESVTSISELNDESRISAMNSAISDSPYRYMAGEATEITPPQLYKVE